MTEPDRRRTTTGPRVLARARPARAVRRPRALPAARTSSARSGRSSTAPARRSAASGRSATAAPHDERVEQLRALGVRRFPTLPYAHKPGVAAYLNDWARGFAADVPESLWSATFYPEPRRAAYVGSWSPPASRCSRCTCRWGSSTSTTRCSTRCGDCSRTAARRSWCTPARARSATTSPARSSMARLLARFPRLRARRRAHGRAGVRASSSRSPSSTSGCTSTPRWCSPTSSAEAPFPRELLPRLADLQPQGPARHRLPDHPYPYAHQLEGLARLDLGDDWLRAVCWENGVRLLGPEREAIFGPGMRLQAVYRAVDNSRGADRFRLGTLVPGEAGRGASVIS